MSRTNPYEVTCRTVKRYYIFGKGYNSEAVAFQQIGRRHVDSLCYEAYLRAVPRTDSEFYSGRTEWMHKWYSERYPARPDCGCPYCQGVRKGWKPNKIHVCCWFAQVRDYKRIGHEAKVGIRNRDGSPLSRPLALPARLEVA